MTKRTVPRALGAALLGLALAACAESTSVDGQECPVPEGGFPPTACALVRGRITTGGGAPVAATGLRVTTLTQGPGLGAYASTNAATNANGEFEIVVYRLNSPVNVPSPDTASVSLNLYSSPDPQQGLLVASYPVRAEFRPYGQAIPLTNVTVTHTP